MHLKRRCAWLTFTATGGNTSPLERGAEKTGWGWSHENAFLLDFSWVVCEQEKAGVKRQPTALPPDRPLPPITTTVPTQKSNLAEQQHLVTVLA